jgi:hypothetical protein
MVSDAGLPPSFSSLLVAPFVAAVEDCFEPNCEEGKGQMSATLYHPIFFFIMFCSLSPVPPLAFLLQILL